MKLQSMYRFQYTHLFRSIVDKDIQLAKSLHMALGKPSTTDLFHEVAGNKVHLRGT